MKPSEYRGRFVVLEPSMVGQQHITLLESYLKALLALDLPSRGLALVYRADASSYRALSAAVRESVIFEPISVHNPMERKWIRKGLNEFQTVRRAINSLSTNDILLVTCVTAPALLLLELGSRAIGTRQATVVLHSELEALFDDSLRSPRRYGFWSWNWSRLRRPDSKLRLAVIAGFIRDALTSKDPQRFPVGSVRVLPFPVSIQSDLPVSSGRHRAVFVGYKTRFKGYDSFVRAAAACPEVDFVVVGGGKVEDVRAGTEVQFGASNDYFVQIAKASVAVFPYTQGYVAAQSAAALDAIAAGVHVLATRRPCFVAMANELGEDAVTLYDSEQELFDRIRDTEFLNRVRRNSAARRSQLANTVYGEAATQTAFDAMLADAGYPSRGTKHSCSAVA